MLRTVPHLMFITSLKSEVPECFIRQENWIFCGVNTTHPNHGTDTTPELSSNWRVRVPDSVPWTISGKCSQRISPPIELRSPAVRCSHQIMVSGSSADFLSPCEAVSGTGISRFMQVAMGASRRILMCVDRKFLMTDGITEALRVSRAWMNVLRLHRKISPKGVWCVQVI